MIEKLIYWDTQLLIFLNGKHNEFWDLVMYWASEKLVWLPLYAFFIFLIFRYYKKDSYWILIFAIMMIAISDQVSVNLFKNIFLRLRPCHEPDLQNIIHLVKNKCGGDYGFVSSHATNHFAMAAFFSIIFFKRIRYFVPMIVLWAAFISYSRIYLGVHYPGDVIVGGIVGSVLGYLFGNLSLLCINRCSLFKRS